MARLAELADTYRHDLFERVIPFWMRHSIDREHGGFFTCLERDGSIYDTRKYVWLNGRQVWTLSKLYNAHERRPEWLEAARGGAEFLRKHAFDELGRCYFSLTREGKPAFYQRKPYAAVFVTIGLLEYSKASGEQWAKQTAVDLFWSIRRWIGQPSLMGRPDFGGAAVSQLADVMVQASMALELAEATDEERYRVILRECLDAALLHIDPDHGVFRENIRRDGAPMKDSPEGRLFCPGHSIEVCWFLFDILRHHPDAAKQQKVLSVLEESLRRGWDDEFGGLYYFMDLENKPLFQLEAPMKLWWPMTEAIYALVYAYSLTRDAKWLRWLELAHEYSYRVFADPKYGEWFGYADRRGAITHTLKGNNYKGCFHVPRALWLSLQKLRELGA
ncbi:MAG: AGE family epimerase/isomerase [Bryobacteraceae bacterium]